MAKEERYETIAGIRVKIASPEECERADVVVCGQNSYFPDDVWTTCEGCGRAICHRPYAPLLPKKVCLRCAALLPQ
jgi:hypothetical protein